MNKMDNNQPKENQTQPNNEEAKNNSSSNQQPTPNNNQQSNNNQVNNSNENKEANQAATQPEKHPQTLEESWAVIADLKRQLDDQKNAGELLGTQINKLKAENDSLQTQRAIDSEKFNRDLEDAKKAIASRLQQKINDWRKSDEEELQREKERLLNEYKEKENYAIEPYAKKLVEILSLFSKAQEEFKLEGSDPAIEAYKRGMQSIHDKFFNLLKEINVVEVKIRPGDLFDETMMHAIDSMPSDRYHHNQVIKIERPCFALNDKIIQVAEVIVAK